MNLRELATRDLGVINADINGGFAWPIVLEAPDGFTSPEPLTGFSQDIGQVIDPDTGVLVSGRLASVSLPIAAIKAAGYVGLPRNIPDAASAPWVVRFNDLGGDSHAFKVSESMPDRTLGNIVLILEAYDG